MAAVIHTFGPATLHGRPLVLNTALALTMTSAGEIVLGDAFAYESEEVARRNFLAAAGRAFREDAGLSENGKESRR